MIGAAEHEQMQPLRSLPGLETPAQHAPPLHAVVIRLGSCRGRSRRANRTGRSQHASHLACSLASCLKQAEEGCGHLLHALGIDSHQLQNDKLLCVRVKQTNDRQNRVPG